MSGRERRICGRRVARSFLRLRNQGVGITGVPSDWMDRERRTGTVEPGPMRFRERIRVSSRALIERGGSWNGADQLRADQ